MFLVESASQGMSNRILPLEKVLGVKECIILHAVLHVSCIIPGEATSKRSKPTMKIFPLRVKKLALIYCFVQKLQVKYIGKEQDTKEFNRRLKNE